MTWDNLLARKNFARMFEKPQASLVSIGANTMMAVWVMPVSWEPLRFALSIGKARFTHEKLRIGGEIKLGAPRGESYEKAVREFGRRSGWDYDKPRPEDFAIHGVMYTFRIESLLDVGDHTLVICGDLMI